MIQDLIAYAEFETIWARFQPETPFGRSEKDALRIHTDAGTLEALWDHTDAALALLVDLEGDPVRSDRLNHHLRRLPRFPESDCTVYDEVELFQVKKFLHNYKALVSLADGKTAATFGLIPIPEELNALLNQGRQGAESFQVADAYDPALAEVRAALQSLDATLSEAQTRRASEVQARFGLAFAGRDFLLVNRDRLVGADAGHLLLLEPYDETRLMVRPLPSPEDLALRERREALLARERALEDAVLARISVAVRQALPRLIAAREAVTAFDLALARARLAQELDLVRPRLTDGPIRLQGGRFLPCQALCTKLDLTYLPLDATLDTAATVIFGSNMGGKTVVLKTLAFLQLCAQTGLFAPATAFETRVFRTFHVIGEGATKEDAKGLSGFGQEIRQVARSMESLDQSALLLFDEFARTTSSREAECLLSALLAQLATRSEVVALFATHFRGVAKLDGVSYRRMGGLRAEGLDHLEGADLEARIRAIDRRMDYRLMLDDGTENHSDAIAVAELLGLDADVVRRAKEFLDS